ncbi:MAG: CDP-archaeol synthase [Anaerolineales bacterium]
MLLQRLLIALLLTPIGLWAMFNSSGSFAIFMGVVCLIAVYEYVRMFRGGGYQPADIALYLAIFSFWAATYYFQQPAPVILIVLFTLIAVPFHLVSYERGRDQAVMDMMVTFSGILYLGVLSPFFLAIRDLPGGAWWLFIVLTSVWWADTGAYAWGSWLGKHLLAPRLSPKKTWEGYIGGFVTALLGAPFLLWILNIMGFSLPNAITVPRVMVIAFFMGIFPTLGDLMISMLKRYFGMKDTGKILMGHGGMLDRIDSWLWGVTIGYFLITELFFKQLI